LQARTKFIIGAAIILVTLVWLGWLGAKESKTYYHTLAELSTMKGPELHQRMRISGYVQKGSIRRMSNQVDFVLTEQGRTLPVAYVGTDPLPDTFYETTRRRSFRVGLGPTGASWPNRSRPSARPNTSLRRVRRRQVVRRRGSAAAGDGDGSLT